MTIQIIAVIWSAFTMILALVSMICTWRAFISNKSVNGKINQRISHIQKEIGLTIDEYETNQKHPISKE